MVCVVLTPPTYMVSAQVQDMSTPSHPRNSAVATLAPLRSVRGTEAAMTTATKPAKAGSSSPFSAGMERELDRFVMSRPRDRYSDGGSNAIVREAQRRAWRRAISEQKRKAAADERKLDALEVNHTCNLKVRPALMRKFCAIFVRNCLSQNNKKRYL